MDDVPFDVVSDYPETGDLSAQTGQEVIDPFKEVRFKIENVEPRVYSDEEGVKQTAKLNVRVSIGALGVDRNGKYAGKNMFQELLTWYNPETYTSNWWQKQARFPYKSFLKAMGFDPANPPKVKDEYLISLKGREFTADIRKTAISVDSGQINQNGKKIYKETGEFKNELANFKAIEELV